MQKLLIFYENSVVFKESVLKEKIIIHIKPEIMDLVPEYIKHRKQDLVSIRGFLAQDQLGEIKTLGHRMKGVGKLYGMDQVTIMGDKIEKAAIIGNKTSIEEALAVLEDFFERLEVV